MANSDLTAEQTAAIERLELMQSFLAELQAPDSRVWMHVYHSAYLKESAWASDLLKNATIWLVRTETVELKNKVRGIK